MNEKGIGFGHVFQFPVKISAPQQQQKHQLAGAVHYAILPYTVQIPAVAGDRLQTSPE